MSGYIHLNGVAWDKAPLPHPRHRCTPQSWAKLDGPTGLGFMVRCACGAAGVKRFAESIKWQGKNSRRIDPLNPTFKPYRRPWWMAIIRRMPL